MELNPTSRAHQDCCPDKRGLAREMALLLAAQPLGSADTEDGPATAIVLYDAA